MNNVCNAVSKRYKQYRIPIRYALFLLGLIFILALGYSNWDQLSVVILSIDKKTYFLSVVIGIMGCFVFAGYFSLLLKKYGVKINHAQAIRMYTVGQIAKYIPGKFWNIAYQISYANNISTATSILMTNIEMMIGGIYLVVLIGCISYAAIFYSPLMIIILVIGIVGFMFLSKSNVISYLVENIFRLFGQEKISFNNEIENISLNKCAIIFILFSSTYILSTYFMLASIYSFTVDESLMFIALLCVSWVAGVLIFIVPHGIGVRELIFLVTSSFIQHTHSSDMLLTIALLGRVSQIVQELTCLIIISMYRNGKDIEVH